MNFASVDGAPDPKTVERFKKYNQNKGWIVIKEGKYPNNLVEGITFLKQAYDQCCDELQLNNPKVIIINNDDYCQQNKSFGGYSPSDNKIYLVLKGRNVSDSMRSLIHEMRHCYQNINNMLKPDSGEDGDDIENDANSYAGKFMRRFNRENPEILFMTFGS